MPYARVLTSTVAGTATAIGIGWLLLTSGAKTDSAKLSISRPIRPPPRQVPRSYRQIRR